MPPVQEQNTQVAQPNSHTTLVVLVLFIIAAIAVVLFAWPYLKLKSTQSLSPAEQSALLDSLVIAGDKAGCQKLAGVINDGIDFGVVCLNNVAMNSALMKLDPKECAQLDDNLMSREDCETQVIMKTLSQKQDLAVCAMASSATVKGQCEQRYWSDNATSSKDSTFCDKLSDTAARSTCRDTYHLNQLIASPQKIDCKVFNNKVYAASCIAFKTALATVKNFDPSVCSDITLPKLQQACSEYIRTKSSL